MMKLIRLVCVFLSLVLQFRSRRSSARCVWRERCVTASVLTPLCTHTLAWQPDTHSWSRMAPVYVMIPQKHTHTPCYFVCRHFRFVWITLSFSEETGVNVSVSSLSPQSFGLMCIQLACYHGVKVLTTSHSPQKHTFLEQLRPSVGTYRPT